MSDSTQPAPSAVPLANSADVEVRPETIGEKIAGCIGVLVVFSAIGTGLYFFGPRLAAFVGWKQTVSEFDFYCSQQTGLFAAANRLREGSSAVETYEYTYKGTAKLDDIDVTIKMFFESGRAEEKRYFEEWESNEAKVIRSDEFDYSEMKRIDLIGTAKLRGVPVLIDVSSLRSELKPVE